MVDIDIGDSFWFVPVSGGKPRKGTTMSLSDKDRLGPSAQVQCLESGAFFVVPIAWLSDTSKSAKIVYAESIDEFKDSFHKLISKAKR